MMVVLGKIKRTLPLTQLNGRFRSEADIVQPWRVTRRAEIDSSPCNMQDVTGERFDH